MTLGQDNECANVQVCTFFQAYGDNEHYRTAVFGFIRMYCRGERQGVCVRKDVGRMLGGPAKVPPNMLPNGLPLAGTDDSSWSEEVKAASRKKH